MPQESSRCPRTVALAGGIFPGIGAQHAFTQGSMAPGSGRVLKKKYLGATFILTQGERKKETAGLAAAPAGRVRSGGWQQVPGFLHFQQFH